jgi:rod shape determining protein RodA
MQDRKANIWQSIDWVTIGLYFLLVSLGWFNIYSAVYTGEQSEAFDFTARYGRQLIWIFASIIIMLIALVIDSKFYSSFSFVIYGVVIFLLIAVLIFGKTINGATSWFVIGPVRLQPSEFAKFATALALAKYLSAYNLKPEKITNELYKLLKRDLFGLLSGRNAFCLFTYRFFINNLIHTLFDY